MMTDQKIDAVLNAIVQVGTVIVPVATFLIWLRKQGKR